MIMLCERQGTDADHLRVLRRDRHSQEDGRCLLDHVECGWPASEGDPQFSDHNGRVAGIARLAPNSRVYPCRHGINRGVHASPNVAKKVLDWDYVIEILRTHLRTRLAAQHRARPDCPTSSREGSIPQGPGASHAQILSPQPQACGGERHV
jgi:hypothetical protein